MCIVLAVLALALGAQQFCRTRRHRPLLWILLAVLVLSAILAAETMASGVAQSLPMLLGGLMLWALLRRGEVGVTFALLALIPLTNLPQLLSLPIADAGTHATVACVVTLALTWWALRYGRGGSMDVRN
jgi:xanthine/uracil permease